MTVSNIEWTEHTWNPIVGCSLKSPGCTNCYAMPMAARIEAMNTAARPGHETAPQYAGTTRKVNGRPVWTGKLAMAPESVLFRPLHRKKPTTYFVNSMGDLFHENVPIEWIDKVFGVILLTPQHTYQIATKRAQRMRDYMREIAEGRRHVEIQRRHMALAWTRPIGTHGAYTMMPPPNVWCIVSTERQEEANERIPLLLQTPCAVRGISAEPLLGPIDLTRFHSDEWRETTNAMTGDVVDDRHRGEIDQTHKLDWVIVGGESGPAARPMHPDWARSLRDQCAAAGVPFFFKQWGNWHPEIDRDRDDPDWRQPYSNYREPHFQILNLAGGRGFHGERVHIMRFCSKKSTGRLLDGVEHNAMPDRARAPRVSA